MNRLHSVNHFLKTYEKLKYENLIVDDTFFNKLVTLYPKEEGKRMFLKKQQLLKGFHEFNIYRMSEYQEPSINPILQDINCKIQEVLIEHNILLEKPVYITSLTNQKIKFAKIKIENEDNIICVYSTTIDFLYFLAVTIGSFCEKVKGDEEAINCNWRKLYDSNRIGQQLFLDIIYKLKAKKWKPSSLWFRVPYIKQYSYLLYSPAEVFGIAHEYAHIIYKHPKGREIPNEENIYNELQADKLAFQITMQYFYNEGSGSMAYIGIEFLFLSLQLYQTILSASTSDNYLPLSDRRLLLREYLKKEFPEEANYIICLCDNNVELIKKLFKDNFDTPLLLDI